MSFADRLKEYRKERCFSQEDLAEQLCVSRQAIGKWEQGQAYPEVEKLLALCSVLSVSMDALMADELPEGCRAATHAPAESILIMAENGMNLVRCINIMCSQPYKSRKGPNTPSLVSADIPHSGGHITISWAGMPMKHPSERRCKPFGKPCAVAIQATRSNMPPASAEGLEESK